MEIETQPEFTREDIIEGLRELYDIAVEGRKRNDPTFCGWPDMRRVLDHIEEHGIPADE